MTPFQGGCGGAGKERSGEMPSFLKSFFCRQNSWFFGPGGSKEKETILNGKKLRKNDLNTQCTNTETHTHTYMCVSVCLYIYTYRHIHRRNIARIANAVQCHN